MKNLVKQAQEKGIILSSTQKLYEKIAKGEYQGLTIPAFNIRTLTFDVSRALFRAVKKEKVGVFIVELASSEMKYTDQSPKEYVDSVLEAAIKENYKGVIFFQGDHFKPNPKKYFNKIEKENNIQDLENLIKKSITAGFYNIDIDASSLVDLNKENAKEQQKENFILTAKLAFFIRKLEQKDITISIGGEVGQIGGKNTTIEEFQEFIKGFNEEFSRLNQQESKQEKGLIKIAVQTGTSHGGVVLPSGEIEETKEDFKTLKEISQEAKKYGMAGVVQHGASTLPEEHFKKFPEAEACEIHLATELQNIIFESRYFPEGLREEMYNWLKNNFSKQKEKYDTEVQFIYKFRKKAFAPFKKQIWKIPQKNIDKICEELEAKFTFFFKALNVSNTENLIKKIYF